MVFSQSTKIAAYLKHLSSLIERNPGPSSVPITRSIIGSLSYHTEITRNLGTEERETKKAKICLRYIIVIVQASASTTNSQCAY